MVLPFYMHKLKFCYFYKHPSRHLLQSIEPTLYFLWLYPCFKKVWDKLPGSIRAHCSSSHSPVPSPRLISYSRELSSHLSAGLTSLQEATLPHSHWAHLPGAEPVFCIYHEHTLSICWQSKWRNGRNLGVQFLLYAGYPDGPPQKLWRRPSGDGKSFSWFPGGLGPQL